MNAAAGQMSESRNEMDRQLFLERLTSEVQRLESVSIALQAALHALPLAASDGDTRKALQSIDRLSQGLACIATVVEGLNEASEGAPPVDVDPILSAIFLEDIRERLLNGVFETPANTEAGEFDMF